MSNHDYKPGDWVQHKDGHVAQHKYYLNGRTFMQVSVPNSGVCPGEQVALWKTADCRPAPDYLELVEVVKEMLEYAEQGHKIYPTESWWPTIKQALSRLDAPEPEPTKPEPEPKKTTPTPINKESGEITLKDLERVLGVKIENTGRACNGMIMAQFPRFEIKEGAFLSGGCGYADTFEDAVRCYLPDIAGRHIVLNSSDPKSRREYILPARIRVGDYFEPEPDYKWLSMDEDGECCRWFVQPEWLAGRQMVYYSDNYCADCSPLTNKPKWLKPCQLWERGDAIGKAIGEEDFIRCHFSKAWNGYWWRLVEDHSTDSACDSQNAGGETPAFGIDWIAPEGNVYEAIRQIQSVVGDIILKGC